ncbi:MAG TPA: DUF397 domain-containing protein, partial [Pseudonocardiaceae bacterium]|nr:DUF397 domain-containing protein [Pseudonocardiaceae bacterium]
CLMVPAQWRKSTKSANSANCVELAGTLDRLRDSKNPDGPMLAASLSALLMAVKSGRFDHCGE